MNKEAPNQNMQIDTGGGANVSESVFTAHDFIGRDYNHINNLLNCPPQAKVKLHLVMNDGFYISHAKDFDISKDQYLLISYILYSTLN